MSAKFENELEDTKIKLGESRNELRHLLHDEETVAHIGHGFPRSKTVQLLTSSPGLGLLAIAAAGFLLMRPQVATRLIRFVPVTAIGRMLALRFFTQSSSRKDH